MTRTRIGRSLRATALALVVLPAGLAGCTRDASPPGFELGQTQRLNDAEGIAGTFSWPYYTAIAARGDDVVAAWLNRNGPRARDLVVRASGDAAASWSAEQVMNQGEYAGTVSVVPKLATLPEGDGLLILWHARRDVAGQKFVLARRSEDFGKSWDAVQTLNSVTQSFLPSVAVNRAGDVIVAFSDERNVQRDIFVNSSTDAGRTWMEQDVRVDRQGSTDSDAPVVALGDDGHAYVAWEERIPRKAKEDARPTILGASSADLGKTWERPRRVAPRDLPATPMWPGLVESNGRLTAAWIGGVTGDSTKSWLWLASSTDRGKTWSKPEVAYDGSLHAFFQIVASGPRVYLVWHAGDSAKPSGVYFNASEDGGATWRHPWSEPLRIDDGKAAAVDGARHPRIAVDGEQSVAITWQEEEKEILLKLSRDGGRTWNEDAIVVGTAETNNTVRYPQVAVSSAGAFVLWEAWTIMTGARKTIADIEKPTPRDVFVRGVRRR